MISSREQVLRLVNSSAEVGVWYKEWNRASALDVLTPDFVPTDTESQLEWQEALKASEDLKVKEKAFTQEIAVAAEALRKVVESVDSRRKSAIKILPNLIKIDRVSVNELPFEDQLILATVTDADDRKRQTKNLILNYKRRLYEAHKANSFVDPFV
jgi:hypothetical protein